MRAWKKQPSDEIRERCLGDIARFLDAAREVESFSPVQQKQVRRRIVRTLFRTRVSTFRARLAPVLAGLGILVIGGAAFATAERLGLIPKFGQNAAGTPAPERKPRVRKHKTVRTQQTAAPGSPVVEELVVDEEQEAAAVESVILPQVPSPLLVPNPQAGTGPWSPEINAATEPARLAPVSTIIPLATAPKLVRPANRPVALVEPAPASSTATAEQPAVPAVEPVPAPPTAAVERPAVLPQFPAAPLAPSPLEAPAVYTLMPSAAKAQPGAPALQAGPAPAVAPVAATKGPVGSAAPIATPKAAPPAAGESGAASQAQTSDQALFGQAMRKLRVDNNPAAALLALQDHAKAYPRSAFAGERNAIEVEALLALHRDNEALARLDNMALDEIPRSGERFVVRGELRAAAHRWPEASADFDRALSRVSGSPAWHERALWGRGVAKLRCGEREAGLADIERYLDRYPKGRFAPEAAKFFPGK